MKMRYQPPKTIINHPGVMECLSGPDGGAPDYAHDVRLKNEWVFTAGRMEGCKTGLFQSVQRFSWARPTLISKLTPERVADLELISGRSLTAHL
jgi:hypothetical protein